MAPEAVMTDGAVAYRLSRAFRGVLARHGLRQILTPPYTPRWNGKAERLIQTLKREWAYAHEWPSSAVRARGLSSWLRSRPLWTGGIGGALCGESGAEDHAPPLEGGQAGGCVRPAAAPRRRSSRCPGRLRTGRPAAGSRSRRWACAPS